MNTLTYPKKEKFILAKKCIYLIIFKLICFVYSKKKKIEHLDLKIEEFRFNKDKSNARDTAKCYNNFIMFLKLACQLAFELA